MSMPSLVLKTMQVGLLAFSAICVTSSVAEEPPPDPRSLLAGVERDLLAIPPGIVKWDVSNRSGEAAVLANRWRLVIAFDGEKRKFDEDRHQLSIDWIGGNAHELIDKRIRLDSLWGGPEAIVRDGLGYRGEYHTRTIYDGSSVMKHSRNQLTSVSDPKGKNVFDPRLISLSGATGSPATTIGMYLAPRADEKVNLVGREAISEVSCWHVSIDGGAEGLERQFWIESSPGHRLHKVEVRSPFGHSVTESEYDPTEKGDSGRFPIRVKAVRVDASGKTSSDLLLERASGPAGAEFGKTLPPETWTFAGLGLPIGEPVYDNRLKRVIGYWDGKALSEEPIPRAVEEPADRPKPPPAKLLEVARRDSGGLLALDALRRIAIFSRSSVEAGEAIPLLLEQHTKSKGAGEVALQLSIEKPEATEGLLRAIVEESPHADDRAMAGFGLARVLSLKSEHLGLGGPGDAAVAEAEQLLERVIAANLDVKSTRFGSLTEAAGLELVYLRGSGIGKPAPALSGMDLAGMPLSLGDYRGKVVVVSFWFTGCPPCIEMIPEERELVGRMKGRPFALLGVNSDEDRAIAAATSQKENMTWPSFWTGEDRIQVNTRWGLHAFPATYVLDPQGLIRFKNLRGEALAKSVESLVDEAERK